MIACAHVSSKWHQHQTTICQCLLPEIPAQYLSIFFVDSCVTYIEVRSLLSSEMAMYKLNMNIQSPNSLRCWYQALSLFKTFSDMRHNVVFQKVFYKLLLTFRLNGLQYQGC